MPILLDTHVWLWWVVGDGRLSKKAKASISAAQQSNDLWLSLISVWEIAKKIELEQTYPGVVKVTVIRETRVSETAK